MTTMCIEDLPRSENVVPFRTRNPLTDDQVICNAIDRALVERVSNTKLKQARVRGMNLFHSGKQMDVAIKTAIAWGECTTDEGPQPPPARAA